MISVVKETQKRVLIATYECGPNYGQHLQNYALSEKLKELGFLPYTLKWWHAYYKTLGPRLDNLRFFRERYINSTTMCVTQKELNKIMKTADIIIIGGDQVFRVIEVRRDDLPGFRFFADFVYGKKVIASYAASFGTDSPDLDSYTISECKKLLQRFDRISVREKSGVDILKKTFDTDAIEVLDPVFLMRQSKYDKLIENNSSIKHINNEYIAYMILGDKEGLGDVDKQLIIKLRPNLLININRNETGHFNTVEQWLYNIKNAKFVITDSFHCVAFCIIYKKPFIVVSRDRAGNARIDNFLAYLGLEKCRRYTLDDIIINDLKINIDWKSIYSTISQRLLNSESYIKEILNIEPKYKKPYKNKMLKKIRNRYDKSYIYRKRSSLFAQMAEKVLRQKIGLKQRVIRIIIKILVDNKKYKKLKKQPLLFFRDSKSTFIRFIGLFYI